MSYSTERAALNLLGFRMFSPSPLLASIVQCYWQIDCELKCDAAPVEYLYSKGGMGMVFNFADAPRFNGEAIDAYGLFDGTNGPAKRFSACGRVHMLGVRFHPGGAYPITKIPLNELSQTPHTLDTIGLDKDGALYDQLAAYQCTNQRILHIERWLQERMGETCTIDRVAKNALKQLQQQHGGISITALCETMDVDRRKLERVFKKVVGFSPKYYSRLLRIEQARTLLKQTPDESLATIGHEAGFCDQSHFNHEFKSLVGVTPTEYLARQQRAKRVL